MAGQFSGPVLRQARVAAGISPERLAIDTGRSVWSIQNYEHDRSLPSVPVLVRLADLLGVRIDDFFVTPGQEVPTP